MTAQKRNCIIWGKEIEQCVWLCAIKLTSKACEAVSLQFWCSHKSTRTLADFYKIVANMSLNRTVSLRKLHTTWIQLGFRIRPSTPLLQTLLFNPQCFNFRLPGKDCLNKTIDKFGWLVKKLAKWFWHKNVCSGKILEPGDHSMM